MVIPGFIDLQVNGFGGIDFNDPSTTSEEILWVAEHLFTKGTAGFLPTVVSNDRSVIENNIVTITKAIQRQRNKGPILGIHLEGPFISKEKGYRGAHHKDYIIDVDHLWFQKLQRLSKGNIRIITLAPESQNAINFIKKISKQVVVAVGHSNASFQTIKRSEAAGLLMATHFGNGVDSSIHRHDNILFHILASNKLVLSIIPDGHHLPTSFLQMIYNTVPVKRIVAVSDSVKFAGMPPGSYRWLKSDVELNQHGRLFLKNEPGLLAGSTCTLLAGMNHLAKCTSWSYENLLQIGFYNPLEILGIKSEAIETPRGMVRFDKDYGFYLA